MEIDKIYPAVVAIGYNRPQSLQRLLASIGAAHYEYENITLIISLDKSDNCEEVLAVAEKFKWNYGEKVIRTFDERQGLRKHVLQCGDLSNQYGAVIILEDDIVVSPEYYSYTVDALEFYGDDDKVAGIALYSHKYNGYAQRPFEPVHNGYDAYMGQFSVTWGQCWNAKQWNFFKQWYEDHQIKLDYKNNIPSEVTNWPETSWGKYFVYYIVENDKYYVMPYEALSTCFADIGQHVKTGNSVHQVPLLNGKRTYRFSNFQNAEKYDIFFESISLKEKFPTGIKSDLCIDLYGKKNIKREERYILTCAKMPFLKIASYALTMRPPELNVRYDIQGEQIFLYDTLTKAPKGKKNIWEQIDYACGGLDWKIALMYGMREFCRKIKSHIFRM
jgi:hypothetical protein